MWILASVLWGAIIIGMPVLLFVATIINMIDKERMYEKKKGPHS